MKVECSLNYPYAAFVVKGIGVTLTRIHIRAKHPTYERTGEGGEAAVSQKRLTICPPARWISDIRANRRATTRVAPTKTQVARRGQDLPAEQVSACLPLQRDRQAQAGALAPGRAGDASVAPTDSRAARNGLRLHEICYSAQTDSLCYDSDFRSDRQYSCPALAAI